jgi:ACR3 family arsenite efflux pump ArsB
VAAVQEDDEQPNEKQFSELLQELRVGLPGVQVLLAFLLVVPFNSGFSQLDDRDRAIYGIAVLAAAVATIFLIAPSAHHRFAWPLSSGGYEALLRIGAIEARIGLIALGIAVTASVFVVADLVYGSPVSVVAAVVLAILLVVFWIAVPLATRRSQRE